jgi:hypothetical protein
MEPLNDDELNLLLKRWEAPEAPHHLRAPFPKVTVWRWLWTGRIHVPVPVGLMALAVVAALWAISLKEKPEIRGTPQPLDNAIHSAAPSDIPQEAVTPKTSSPIKVLVAPASSPNSQPAALAGFLPVREFEPKVVGVMK